MSFNALGKIKEIAKNADEAIAFYGEFVEFYENLENQIKTSKRHKRYKGWTNERITLCRARQTIPVIHEAITNRFGQETVYLAINTHPFR
jgi:hypothetical protein